MLPQGLIFVIMVAAFMATAFGLKLPIGICLAIASMSGAISAGQGIALRHLVEGSFGYLNTILVIGAAMMFMKAIQKSGLLDTVARWLVETFYRSRALLLVGLTVLVMFPGMITGSSTASVLTAGALVAPVLMALGVPRKRTAAMIAMAGIYGMLAPPVNIPAMIIGGGIDMPYVGFGLPLLFATLPLAVAVSLILGLPHMKRLGIGGIRGELPESYHGVRSSALCPFIVLVVLARGPNTLPGRFGSGDAACLLDISCVACLTDDRRTCDRPRLSTHTTRHGNTHGRGMFIQVMTLTGVRGWVVANALGMPKALLYLAIAISMPAFGAVSAFGSSSVLGVPFILALLGTQRDSGYCSSDALGFGQRCRPQPLPGFLRPR